MLTYLSPDADSILDWINRNRVKRYPFGHLVGKVTLSKTTKPSEALGALFQENLTPHTVIAK